MSDPITGLDARSKASPAPANPVDPPITESQLGIPFYPNALPAQANGLSDSSTNGPGDTMILLQTHDPVEKVVAFYMDKLKSSGGTDKPAAPSESQSSIDGKPVFTLSQIAGRTLRAAEIRQVDNMTVIELMRMEAPMHGSASLPNNIPAPGTSGTPGMGGTPGVSGTPGMGATPGMGGTLGSPSESGVIAPGAKPQDPGLNYP